MASEGQLNLLKMHAFPLEVSEDKNINKQLIAKHLICLMLFPKTETTHFMSKG